MSNINWSDKNDGVVVNLTYSKPSEYEQWVLLTSDVHKDSKKCNTSYIKKHLDQALEKKALIIDNGDWFAVMGGKYDKRTSKSDILPKFQKGNYFDLVVDDSIDFLGPYAKNIVVLGEGNHEQAVNARHETNLTKRLAAGLNLKYGGNVLHQKYDGFIKFYFSKKDNSSGHSMIMYRNHGFGGNSPATLGVSNTAKTQVMVDADIYVYGHIHNKWVVVRTKKSMDQNMNMVIKDQTHIQLSTYKDSTESQWEVSKGFAPPSLGGAWLKFYFQYVGDGKYMLKCQTILID